MKKKKEKTCSVREQRGQRRGRQIKENEIERRIKIGVGGRRRGESIEKGSEIKKIRKVYGSDVRRRKKREMKRRVRRERKGRRKWDRIRVRKGRQGEPQHFTGKCWSICTTEGAEGFSIRAVQHAIKILS